MIFRRRAAELEDLLYAESWAAVHAVNGTTPDDPAVAEALENLYYDAAVHLALSTMCPGVTEIADLDDEQQVAVYLAAHAALVEAGHMDPAEAAGWTAWLTGQAS